MKITMDSKSLSSNFWVYLGTFLICCSLLAFEVSTVRTINFAIGPSYIFVAISLAMLGLTAAGSLLSLFDLTAIKARREFVLSLLCVLIAVLLVLSSFYVADTQNMLKAELRQAGELNGLRGVLKALLSNGTQNALHIGLFLALPYFLFGSVLSYLFATSRTREYSRLYAADLLGAAVGCVSIIVVMEFTSYATSVTAPAICALLAAAAYTFPAKRAAAFAVVGSSVFLALLTQTAFYQDRIVPMADPNYLVRDYSIQTEQVERWSGWNSYTRVGAIEAKGAPGRRAVLSLANGDGMAFLYPQDPNRGSPLRHEPALAALLPGAPETALVVFAGAGADMMSLLEHGTSKVVGVELNSKIVEAGLALPDYKLSKFLELDGVSLNIQEARSFLEQDNDRYDLVLVSWSGATAAYYLGALGGTTQHLFTYEGLSAILDRLDADGYAVVLQSNKVDTLDGLRRYMEEHGLANPERAAIVLFRDNTVRRWDLPWDENPLLMNLNGWSETEVANIQSKAAEQGFNIAYAPGLETHPDYLVYERLLTSENLDTEIAAISKEAGQRFGIATDDRPFYLDHFQTARYFGSEFWSPSSFDRIEDAHRYQQIMFISVITALAFLLSLVPLAYKRKKLSSRRSSATYLLYFMLLGAGFMFIEIGMIQRTGILFGNPGLTIAIVLGVIISSTGLGSLMSSWSFSRGLSIKSASLLVVIFALATALAVPSIVNAAIGFSLPAKVAIVILLIAPGGVVMGHLFPWGLELAGKEDKSLTSWAWAINGAMSASVAGIAPLVAQASGFNALFYIGAVLYSGVFLTSALMVQTRADI